MSVVIRLIDADEPVTWENRRTRTETVKYAYELHSSGALVVHRTTTKADRDGYATDFTDIETMYGPAAWLKVSGNQQA
ncbi:hypothetical protein ACWGQ5_30430 [Streptomyces sp. NPDC055722]